MVRYHLGLDGTGAKGGKRMRPVLGLLAYASITGDATSPRCPAPPPWSSGTTSASSTTTSRTATARGITGPTLWAVHGIPQAINAGDTLFTLSRIALHRLTDLGFSDAKVLRLMRLYDETCLRAVRGPVHRHLDQRARRHDVGRPLLRHDRAQDRRPDLRVDRGRRAPRDRRRRGDRPLPLVRLGARDRVPAQRRPARDLGRAAGDRQGAVGPREAQEDAAGHLRVRARRRRRPRPPRARSTQSSRHRSGTSRRPWPSSSAPARATTRATRRAGIATKPCASSMRQASWSTMPGAGSRT